MRGVAPLFEVEEAVVTAPHGSRIQLPALQLGGGDAAVLLGPSGTGKSTLLLAVCGLLQRPGWSASARVRWRGGEMQTWSPAQWREWRWRDLAFLPQDAHAALDALQPLGRQLVSATGRTEPDIAAMLTRLGVADAGALLRRVPHRISGGQAQRALLAIAFLRAPALVVVDEPSASLDGSSYGELVAHLRTLRAKGTAVLAATHDRRLVPDLGATAYRLVDGTFVVGSAAEPPWPLRTAAPPGDEVVLAARDLVVEYGDRRVLDRVDFECRRAEIVAIVGDSGSGKSTLLRVLAGQQAPAGGVVARPGRRPAVQLVRQDAYASLTPGVPLARLLAEAHAPGFAAAPAAAALQLPASVLTCGRERMSGGERRRSALLRALAVAPKVLLLDEPTASLDRAAAESLLAVLLARQREDGMAIVMVTHELELARSLAHRVLVMQGGRLCAG